MVKIFTEKDIEPVRYWDSASQSDKCYLRISADHDDLIDAPMWFHLKGLSETRSGYGNRLNSGLKINFEGRQYRVYTTIFSNCGTNWFKSKGRKIIIS